MARGNGNAAQKEQRHPIYTVVEIASDGKLTVIDAEVQAKTQEAAMDQTWESLPAERKKIVLGAYLASSYREIEYDEEVVRKPKKKARDKRPTVVPSSV